MATLTCLILFYLLVAVLGSDIAKLVEELSSQNITVVLPSDSAYANATEHCQS